MAGISDAVTAIRTSVNHTLTRASVTLNVAANVRAPLQLDCEAIADQAEVCTVPTGPSVANALSMPSLAGSNPRRPAARAPLTGQGTPEPATDAVATPAVVSGDDQPAHSPLVTVQNRQGLGAQIDAAIAGSTSEVALASRNADGVVITPQDRAGAINALTAAIRRDTATYSEVARVRDLFNRRFGTNYTTDQFNYVLGAARYSLEAGGQALPDGRRVYAKLTRAAWVALAAHAIQLADHDGTLRFGNQRVNVPEATRFVEAVLTSNVAEDLRRSGRAGTEREVADEVEAAGQRFMSTPLPGQRQAAARMRTLPGQREDEIVVTGRRQVGEIYARTPELRNIAIAGTVSPSAPLAEGVHSTGVTYVAYNALSPTQRRAIQLEEERQASFDRAMGRATRDLDGHRRQVARFVERRIEVREAELDAEERDPAAPHVIRA